MKEELICPWRFGEKYLVTDFVMCNNVSILEEYERLNSEDNDIFVENVAKWIREEFNYPIDQRGLPAPQGEFSRYRRTPGKWYFHRFVDYAWSLPNEVVFIKQGICIDTTNLTESIFRVKPLNDASVCLGEVRRSKDDELVGYHAWQEVTYQGKTYVLETTFHAKEDVNLLERDVVYNKELENYYVLHARYNESNYEPITTFPILIAMGLPPRRIALYGVDRTYQSKSRLLFDEWREQEMQKQKEVWQAWQKKRI